MFFTQNYAKFQSKHGGYVAVFQGKLRVHASTMDEMVARLEKERIPPSEALVQYLPKPNESIRFIHVG